MGTTKTRTLNIRTTSGVVVDGIATVPCQAEAANVLAHGVDADMADPFMTAVAEGLAQRQIGTLRYRFPYMQGGQKPSGRACCRTRTRTCRGSQSEHYVVILAVVRWWQVSGWAYDFADADADADADAGAGNIAFAGSAGSGIPGVSFASGRQTNSRSRRAPEFS